MVPVVRVRLQAEFCALAGAPGAAGLDVGAKVFERLQVGLRRLGQAQRVRRADAAKFQLVLGAVLGADALLHSCTDELCVRAGGFDLLAQFGGQQRRQCLDAGFDGRWLVGGQVLTVEQRNDGAAVIERGQLLAGLGALLFRLGQLELVRGDGVGDFSVGDQRGHGVSPVGD